LAVGYFASGNPINVSSFDRLRDVVAGQPRRRSSLKFILGGSICDKVTNADPFVALGKVDRPEDFYDQTDIVINPMVMGTGLKIKSVEAIFWGLPLLATAAAMNGLPTNHRLHTFAQPEELADSLAQEHFKPELLSELAAASRTCAGIYENGVRAAIIKLLQTIVDKKCREAVGLGSQGIDRQHMIA
jgi:hypothetical protein